VTDTTRDTRGAPTHSVLRDGRLVAFIWAHPDTDRPEGGLRVGRHGRSLIEVPFAEIELLDLKQSSLLLAVLPDCKGIDTLTFRLGLEDCDVRHGAAEPHAGLRRF